ncbi:MAG: ABC transporter ATP-binding protein [Limisphaerales bacterium]
MSEAIISVEGLGKKYRIGHQRQSGMRYKSLRDVIAEKTKGLFRKMGERRKENGAASRSPLSPLPSPHPDRASHEDFWALKDVSFEVKQGEVVGIIGRNGAGKSTLLKILSRITEPTEGRVRLRGRVASLLEVGTGFHPELTGRENIFLNGAILGMHRSEIKQKFDEIVAFAEVKKFLDTPVKRYSSGMYVRLAFAVAAHLEPEILIVDEVLAVGDAQFQKKCLGKMESASRSGRTVLFVSHNMATVVALCSRAVYLKLGCVVTDSSPSKVIDAYLVDEASKQGEVAWPDPLAAPGNDHVRLTAVRTLQEGVVTSEVDMAKSLEVQLQYRVFAGGRPYGPSIHLLDRMGTCILATGNGPSATLGTDPWTQKPMPSGEYCASCYFPPNFFNEGQYFLNAFVTDNLRVEAMALEALAFAAHDTGSMRDDYQGIWIGLIRPMLEWNTTRIS